MLFLALKIFVLVIILLQTGENDEKAPQTAPSEISETVQFDGLKSTPDQ